MQHSTNSLSTKGKEFNAQLESVKSNMAHEFQSFVTDIEDLVKATTSLTGEELAKAKQKLQQRIEHAKESAEEIGETIVARAKKTAETTNNYVHDQPWNAVGAGAAVGLLVGFLLARR